MYTDTHQSYQTVISVPGGSFPRTEVGIYKRKQESKKTRKQGKQELDQESDKEKESLFFFSWSLSLSSS